VSHPPATLPFMNRVSHTFPNLDLFLADVEAKPLDMLTLDRRALIDLVKSGLNEFHQQRRLLAGTAGHLDAVNKCRFWDQILGWLKDSDAEKVTLVRP